MMSEERFELLKCEPLIDKEGNPTEKGSWSNNDEDAKLFNEHIRRKINNTPDNFPVTLSSIVFPTYIEFPSINKIVLVDFQDCVFGNIVRFSGNIVGSVNFTGCTFEKSAFFKDIEINGVSNFSKVEFKSDVVFENARFGSMTQFQETQFRGTTVLKIPNFWIYPPLEKQCSFVGPVFKVLNFIASPSLTMLNFLICQTFMTKKFTRIQTLLIPSSISVEREKLQQAGFVFLRS